MFPHGVRSLCCCYQKQTLLFNAGVSGGRWLKDIDMHKWDYVFNMSGMYKAQMSTE